jgi:hypothetical protein
MKDGRWLAMKIEHDARTYVNAKPSPDDPLEPRGGFASCEAAVYEGSRKERTRWQEGEPQVTERTEDHSPERHPIRVVIRDEDIEDVGAHSWMHVAPEGTDDDEGHGWKFKVGQTEEEDEGQVYVMSVQREGDPADAEGQRDRGSFLRFIDPDDTEGQGARGALLYPADSGDVEGKGFRAGVLKPDESGSWTLELDDT